MTTTAQALKRLMPLVPTIKRVAAASSRAGLAAVQVHPSGWVGVTDGHRMARVHIPGLGGDVVHDLPLEGLALAVKGEKQAWDYLRGEDRDSHARCPDLHSLKCDGPYVEWSIDHRIEETLKSIILAKRQEYVRARAIWVADFSAQAKALEEQAKAANDRLKAFPRPAKGDIAGAKAYQEAKRAHGSERGRIAREKRLLQGRREKAAPSESYGIKLVPGSTGLMVDVGIEIPTWIKLADWIPRSAQPDTQVGVDARYLLDAIKAMRGKGGTVISISQKDACGVIKVAPLGEDAYSLVMPMRI